MLMELGKNTSQVSELSIELIEEVPVSASRRAPILFVHGAYTGAWCWRPHFMPYLAAKGYHSFAMSLRGHGGSAGRSELSRWGIGDYVADVARMAEAVRTRTGRVPVIVGHSMGGFLAMQHARDHRVAGLALLATVPPEGLIGSALHLFWRHPQLLWELNLVQHGDCPPRLAKLREMLFSNEIGEAELVAYAACFQPESERALIDMTLPQFDLREPQGRPPALVLMSEHDMLMPAYLGHCAARYLGVKAHTVDHLGHLMMLDARWRAAADMLLEWLEELP